MKLSTVIQKWLRRDEKGEGEGVVILLMTSGQKFRFTTRDKRYPLSAAYNLGPWSRQRNIRDDLRVLHT